MPTPNNNNSAKTTKTKICTRKCPTGKGLTVFAGIKKEKNERAQLLSMNNKIAMKPRSIHRKETKWTFVFFCSCEGTKSTSGFSSQAATNVASAVTADSLIFLFSTLWRRRRQSIVPHRDGFLSLHKRPPTQNLVVPGLHINHWQIKNTRYSHPW